MSTVMTPEAVASSFRRMTLQEMHDADDVNESFYFRYPSADRVSRDNGDGDLLDLWDYSPNLSWIETSDGEISTTPDTVVWVR